jgi:glycosyltransferase involved in cell wall biosynthesis
MGCGMQPVPYSLSRTVQQMTRFSSVERDPYTELRILPKNTTDRQERVRRMTKQETKKIPAVSIGLPVYNGEEYIRVAIDSVLSQTFDDFELIISDNASSDATEAICQDCARSDPRVRYMRQSENLGALRNFKLVANEASGTYFTWLAHDDRLKPDYLDVMIKYLRRHPQVVVVLSDFSVTDHDDKVIGQVVVHQIREDIDWNQRLFYFFEHPISDVLYAIYGVMRTKTCKNVLSKSPNSKNAIEVELPILCRFAVVGEIVSLPMILREYRIHATSYSNTAAVRAQKESWFRRNLFRLNNWNRSRMQQLSVLWTSSLPLRLKTTFTMRVLFSYMTFTFRQFSDALTRWKDRRVKNSSSS